MIKSFRHKVLELFFTTGAKSGIQPHHASKLKVQLTARHAAESPDVRTPNTWRLHQLGGEFVGFWSLTVSGNWRIIFRFDGNDVVLVDYLCCH